MEKSQELIGILQAISIVAKSLAAKLMVPGETKDQQKEVRQEMQGTQPDNEGYENMEAD